MTETKEKVSVADAWRLLTEQMKKRPGAAVLIHQALSDLQWEGSLEDYHQSTTTPDDEKIEQYRKFLQLILNVKRTPFKTADDLFKELCAAIKTAGGDTHKRIAAHLRGKTGRFVALPVYHNDTSINQDAKVTLYTELLTAVKSKDFSRLSGTVGAGDKRAEEEATIDGAKKSATRATTPEPPLESAANEPILASPRQPVKSEDETDDIAQAILRAIQPRLKVPQATVDEKQVRAIAGEVAEELIGHLNIKDDEEILNLIKHAMGNGHFPTDRVKALIDEKMAGLVMRVEITKPSGEVKEIGRQHYKFPLLMAALSQRLNVALVGPAGSSKTTTAHHAAKALDMVFEAISVGPMTSKADLLGFIDAGGKYHDTATVRRAEQGGIMLWDEFDTANASVATYGNMLLANDSFGTPIGMKQKHKDFCLIAGLNTYGMGANRVYVGRNQLDGATLDRFVMIDWDYDEGLEGAIVGVTRKSPVCTLDEGGILTPDQWMDYVLKVRKACEQLAIRHVISPRATIHGSKLFAVGVGRKHVEQMVLFKGLDAATVTKILSACQ